LIYFVVCLESERVQVDFFVFLSANATAPKSLRPKLPPLLLAELSS
jgi:hypothetical protein